MVGFTVAFVESPVDFFKSQLQTQYGTGTPKYTGLNHLLFSQLEVLSIVLPKLPRLEELEVFIKDLVLLSSEVIFSR